MEPQNPQLLSELEIRLNERMNRLEDKLEQRGDVSAMLKQEQMQNQPVEALRTSVQQNSIRITYLEEATNKVKEPSENQEPSQKLKVNLMYF